MNAFRSLLAALFVAIAIYTFVTGANHGWNLVPVFFGDMAEMTWRGQFNFDFMTFLLLSGLWVSWRNGFTVPALMLGAVAVFFGMMFLSAYLLYLSFNTNGDIRQLLMGVNAD